MASNTLTPGNELDLLHTSEVETDGPVECLGKTFPSDAERRKHYVALLAEKLKDPDFRKIEGFPIGEDEDILELSDPPYYTACPNPFIEDFIAYYGRPYDPGEEYKREPYAADVSEGKTESIYTVHSYHTKVPHKAIMRYLLHYTMPGDVILDSFCGTGMTGLAAQLCESKSLVETLGYRVTKDGDIYRKLDDSIESGEWQKFSELGPRRAVLNDLSPAATFISSNYNNNFNLKEFKCEIENIIRDLEENCSWMYETLHSDNKTKGKIKYTVWSDVFICSECTNDVVFWNDAVSFKDKKVNDPFLCGSCGANLKKNKLQRVKISKYDYVAEETLQIAKQVPVLIAYNISGKSTTFQKIPDDFDLKLISRINDTAPGIKSTASKLPKGSNTRQPLMSHGIKYMHQFYTSRNLNALSTFYAQLVSPFARFVFTGIACRSTQMNRIHIKKFFFGGGGWNAGYLKGTLYVPSIPIETSVIDQVVDRANAVIRAFSDIKKTTRNIIETKSSTNNYYPDNSIDYIFLDPPFGSNINYSELNSIWESWLKVLTNNKLEAIENSTQEKGLDEYRGLIGACFSEAYRVLKPGRWMTIEFSNTKASVWNSIQTALTDSGFIVANVSALNKKQGSFKSVNTPTAVKQDLVISAYKPNGGFEARFLTDTDVDGVWDFVRTHLGYLPIVKKQSGELVKINERDPRILFDQVVSYFVRSVRDVPISSKEFQEGLAERFAERDGMVFLLEQIAEYDKASISSSQIKQLSIFVDDESSAIEWLRQLLNNKPQSYQDMHPKFINELSGWKKAEEQLELSKLLEQNFLKYDTEGLLPPQIHSYLSSNFKEMRNLTKNDSQLLKKAKDRWYVPNPEREEDLQKLRDRDLLKQFAEYKEHTGRKLKTVRLEAVRCGFKKAWQERDYTTIITVAEKIPQDLLQEDQKLLMWYDQAQTRTSDESLF